MASDNSPYDAEWDQSIFTASMPVVRRSPTPEQDDWEPRYIEDTAGYVSNPLMTSFTDLDLGPALLKLGKSAEWSELDSWLEA